MSAPTASSRVDDHTEWRSAVDGAPGTTPPRTRENASDRLVEFVIAPALFVLLVFLVL